MNIKFSPPDITEEEIDEVVDTLKSGWITTGPKTKLFENRLAEYCGTDRCVCLNSATACLELILRAVGIGEGDEVITSAYTYTASASVIAHVGAKIVLCDTQSGSFEMNYEKLSELINERTKAIIAVDVAGVICDYDKIIRVAESKRELFRPRGELQQLFNRCIVIADGAHSFGASRKGLPSGNIADFTAFSFHAVKNLTTAEGGALTWKSREGIDGGELYRKFMLYSLHGQDKDALAKAASGGWEYDIKFCGYKYNMTDITASIGLAQLKRYAALLASRKRTVDFYGERLKAQPVRVLKHYGEDFCGSMHLYPVWVEGADEARRNDIIKRLAENGIAVNVHYKPLPMLTAYRNMGFRIEDFPNAFALYKNEITLPCHTLLSDTDKEFITDALAIILKNE